MLFEVHKASSNDQRSRAGSVTPSTTQDDFPALAGAWLLGIELLMAKFAPENLQYYRGSQHCRETTHTRDHNNRKREGNFPCVPLVRVQQIALAKKHDRNCHRDQRGEPGVTPTRWTMLRMRAPTTNACDVGSHSCRDQEEDGDFDHVPNDERSHAGRRGSGTQQGELPALAGAIG